MPAQVSAPDFQVGNQWRYAVHDGYTKLPRGTVEYRVSSVQGDTVTVNVVNNSQASVELYSRDGNWLRHPAPNLHMLTYSPPYPAYVYPLAPGKSWNIRVTATDPATGQRVPVTVQARVLGWERIRVPAGEFDTLKLKRDVFVDYWVPNVRGPNVANETEWYSPVLKQAARREVSGRYLSFLATAPESGFIQVRGRSDGGGPRYIDDSWTVEELVSHTAR
jgi:hypothetical protein